MFRSWKLSHSPNCYSSQTTLSSILYQKNSNYHKEVVLALTKIRDIDNDCGHEEGNFPSSCSLGGRNNSPHFEKEITIEDVNHTRDIYILDMYRRKRKD